MCDSGPVALTFPKLQVLDCCPDIILYNVFIKLLIPCLFQECDSVTVSHNVHSYGCSKLVTEGKESSSKVDSGSVTIKLLAGDFLACFFLAMLSMHSVLQIYNKPI